MPVTPGNPIPKTGTRRPGATLFQDPVHAWKATGPNAVRPRPEAIDPEFAALRLLLYFSDSETAGRKLLEAVYKRIPPEETEVHRDMKSLSDRFRRPRGELRVAVILCSSREELSQIVSLGPLISDLRILLLLPDRERETIARGHTLYPRFLSFVDESFEEVGAVLGKMLARSGS